MNAAMPLQFFSEVGPFYCVWKKSHGGSVIRIQNWAPTFVLKVKINNLYYYCCFAWIWDLQNGFATLHKIQMHNLHSSIRLSLYLRWVRQNEVVCRFLIFRNLDYAPPDFRFKEFGLWAKNSFEIKVSFCRGRSGLVSLVFAEQFKTTP